MVPRELQAREMVKQKVKPNRIFHLDLDTREKVDNHTQSANVVKAGYLAGRELVVTKRKVGLERRKRFLNLGWRNGSKGSLGARERWTAEE